VGDPLNAVRIFNEKEVDELIVLDIDASRLNREPDYSLIERLASECRMPLCYGGGVKSLDQVQQIVSLGVEKVAISTSAIDSPGLITQAAEIVGSQSVVVVIDVAKKGVLGRYQVMTQNGSKKTGLTPQEFSKEVERLGAGEIVINSVDRDGKMEGYDIELISEIRSRVSVPLTCLGGAGSAEHVSELLNSQGLLGIAAGSMFVFKGKYRAVLISYPNHEEKMAILVSGSTRAH